MKSDLEVKINREISDYTEEMFFGLSLRQFIFSALACMVAVGVYFLLKPLLGLETTSWVCILAAVPFGAMGFVRYNGMPAEKVLQAWFRSAVLMPKHLAFGNTSLYKLWADEMRTAGKRKRRRGRRHHDKDTKQDP